MPLDGYELMPESVAEQLSKHEAAFGRLFHFPTQISKQIGAAMLSDLTSEQIDVRALEYERVLRKRAFVYLNMIVERREKSPRSITYATLHLPPRSGMSPRQLWVIDADNARLHLSVEGHENFTHPLAAEALRLLHQEHRGSGEVARLLGVGTRTLTSIVDEALIMYALAIADMPLGINDYYEQIAA